jgi:hypothetical protein
MLGFNEAAVRSAPGGMYSYVLVIIACRDSRCPRAESARLSPVESGAARAKNKNALVVTGNLFGV